MRPTLNHLNHPKGSCIEKMKQREMQMMQRDLNNEYSTLLGVYNPTLIRT